MKRSRPSKPDRWLSHLVSPRHQVSPDNRPVFAAKQVLLELLICLFDIRLTVRLGMLLSLCKMMSKGSPAASALDPNSFRPSTLRVPHGSKSAIQDITARLTKEYVGELNDILSFLSIPEGGSGGKFCRVLLDMMRYRDEEVSTLAMQSLLRDCSPKLELFRSMHDVLIAHGPREVTACIEIRDTLYPQIRSMFPQVVSHLMRQDASFGERPPLRFDKFLAAIRRCAELFVAAGNGVREMAMRNGTAELVLQLFAHTAERPKLADAGSIKIPAGGDATGGWDKQILVACCDFIESFCEGGSLGWGLGGKYGPGQHKCFAVVPHLLRGLVRGCGWDGSRALKNVFEANVTLLAKVTGI